MSAAVSTDSLGIARAAVARGWHPIPLDHPGHRRCIGTGETHDPRECEAGVSGNGLPRESRRGKHPVGGWSTIAATELNPKLLDHYFARRTVNVGIATQRSGLFVVDEDQLGAFEKLCDELGHPVPCTYRVRTAKGWHWYFRAPTDVVLSNASGVLKARGMDVRGGKGSGGYVVGTGSLHHTGHVYAAEDDDAAVLDTPAWLVGVLTDPGEVDGAPEEWKAAKPRSTVDDPGDVRADTLEAFVTSYQARLDQVSTPGYRHTFFLAARDAWRLYDLGGLTAKEMEADLDVVAQVVWGADLDARDRTIWRVEARRAATASPWELLETGGTKIERTRTRTDSATTGDPVQVEASARPSRFADLAAYLDGDPTPEPTERGVERTDGVPLLYPGRDHTAIGETEAGKSWLALACTLRELQAGRRVLYLHFEESDPRSTILRLRQMGAGRALLGGGAFAFAGIDTPCTNPIDLAELVDFKPDLVILDGVNAAMTLHGWDTDKADGVGVYRSRLVAPFLATGAATLALDHVVKNPEQRGNGYAMGSAMKLNMVSGASFLLESREPLRPGHVGTTSIYVVKDRPGALRAVSIVKAGRRALFASMTVDSRTALTAVRLSTPLPAADDVQDDRDRRGEVDGAAIRVLRVIAEMGAETERKHMPSTREVRNRKGGIGVKTDAATVGGYLDTLEAHGLIENEVTKGPARWRVTEKGARASLANGSIDPLDL